MYPRHPLTFLVKLRLSDLRLKVNMMCVIILPSFLPKTFNLPHLNLCINVALYFPRIELPYLLLQAIRLNEALVFLDPLSVSQVFIMLSLHTKIL